jgi:hypothetical protein
MNVVVSESGIGGASTFVCGKTLVGKILAEHGELLECLCRPDLVTFRRYSNFLMAPILQFTPNGDFRIRFRFDENIYFSPVITEHIALLKLLINDTLHEMPFAAGQGYIIDNIRNLHGRRGFVGDREVWRILINGEV